MKRLQERQTQIKSEILAIKLEIKEEERLLSGMDASALRPSGQSGIKRKFEDDNDGPADVSPSKTGASHERLVKPRLDTN